MSQKYYIFIGYTIYNQSEEDSIEKETETEGEQAAIVEEYWEETLVFSQWNKYWIKVYKWDGKRTF